MDATKVEGRCQSCTEEEPLLRDMTITDASEEEITKRVFRFASGLHRYIDCFAIVSRVHDIGCMRILLYFVIGGFVDDLLLPIVVPNPSSKAFLRLPII